MQKLNKDGNPVSLVPFAGLHGAVYGGTLPARVWTSYMRTILEGTPAKDFPQPVFGGTAVNAAPTPSATPSDPVGVALQQRPAAAQADADADAEPAGAVTHPDPHPDAVGVRHDTHPAAAGIPPTQAEAEAEAHAQAHAGRAAVWARMRR